MGETSRLTISLPADLLEAMDRKLTRRDESRSALVRRLVEEALHEVEEQEKIERYVRSYLDEPQTEEEFGWSDEVTRRHLAELPWK